MKIERVEVQVVGPETKRYTWSHDLPEQFQNITLLRIFTDDGAEGLAAVWNAASYDYERFTAEALRHLMPILIGRDPAARDSLLYDLRARVYPQPPGALALIDIALWDLAARLENKPIYELLGAARDSIASYASTPMLKDVDEYLAVTEDLLSQGFRAVKFHTWCVPDDDLALARAARRHFLTSLSCSMPRTTMTVQARYAWRRSCTTWNLPGSKRRCRITISRAIED